MPANDLRQDDFAVAFAFSRSEASGYTGADGATHVAPIDAPRFDHDTAGAARGLLLTAGSDIGAHDRISLDPLLVPVALIEGPLPSDLEATVFHTFAPITGGSWTVERRAFYTRNALASIDGILSQAGHHLEIGLVTGFRPNLGGFVRLRGQVWTLPSGLAGNRAEDALAADSAALKPVIVAGAEII